MRTGADVNLSDAKGRTALMYLAQSSFRLSEAGAHGDGAETWLRAFVIIEDLIQAGANINAQDQEGNTALILSLKANNIHFAETLIKSGADIDIVNIEGKTAEDFKLDNYETRRDSMLKMIERIRKTP